MQEGEQSEGGGTAKCPRTGQCACGSKPACARQNRSRTCALQCGRTRKRATRLYLYSLGLSRQKKGLEKEEGRAGFLRACGLAPMETRWLGPLWEAMDDGVHHVIVMNERGAIHSMDEREDQTILEYSAPSTRIASWGMQAIRASEVRTCSLSPSVSPHLFAPRSASPQPAPRSRPLSPHPAPRPPPLSPSISPHLFSPSFRSPC